MKESWQPHGSLGGIVILLGQNLTNFGKKELVKNGMKHISWGRFWVLQALNEAPQNQASLCKKLGQKAPSMIDMLRRLNDEKIIKFIAHPNDVRRKEWSLTTKGKKDYQKAKKILRNIGFKMDTILKENKVEPSEIQRVNEILSLLNNQLVSDMSEYQEV